MPSLQEDSVGIRQVTTGIQHRQDIRNSLQKELPGDWGEMSQYGPGSDFQAKFSRQFCARMAEQGWLTQHWPDEYGGQDCEPWRHSIVGEELWAIGEPRG